MVYLAKHILKYKNQSTIIFLTDRNELDDQLNKTFVDSCEYLGFPKSSSTFFKKIDSRNDLVDVLKDRKSYGMYFSTVQKFSEETGILSDRDDIYIIADEAHRSHNNLNVDYEVDNIKKEIKEKHGYAEFIRIAFPKATFFGFTGTPLMGDKKNTERVFGQYEDKYLMNQAVLDGSTVSIYYQKRKVLALAKEENLKYIDEFYEQDISSEEEGIEIQEEKYKKIKNKILNLSTILSQGEIINEVVGDFWEHYNSRKDILNGKAMFVAYDRKIAFDIYQEMINQNPEFKDKIILVITGSNKDKQEMIDATPSKEKVNEYAIEFKKDTSKYKIAIVVDMWLTGFDVPDLDTLYLFKIIKWHNLMQTIARVNRTYYGKELDPINVDENNKPIEIDKIKYGGLIVDYLDIWKYLSKALNQYNDIKDNDSTFDVENLKTKLLDLLKSIDNEFFSKEEYKVMYELPNKQFEVIENSSNKIFGLTKEDQNRVFRKIKNINRYYSMVSSILNNDEILHCKFYLLVKQFCISIKIDSIDDFSTTINKLRRLVDESITSGGIQVQTLSVNNELKDLTYITNVNVDDKNRNIAKINLERNIKTQIRDLNRRNPILSKKLSEDLKNLLNKFDQDTDLEKFKEALIEMSKIIANDNTNQEFPNDEKLQSFYSILSNDEKAKMFIDTKLFNEIAKKLMDTVKSIITNQWWTSKRARSEVRIKLEEMLARDYNYPPKEQQSLLDNLISQLEISIKIDREYFLKEEDL